MAYNTGHELLKIIPPELAHSIAKKAMKRGLSAPGPCIPGDFALAEATELFGFVLDNPLGIAAGFDKHGELADNAREYGFGWIEEGSITYHGGPGNKGRRLARVKHESGEFGLWNRMGLNGDRAEVVVGRLKNAQNPYAVNIAKTHNKNIMGDKAIEDMVGTYELVEGALSPTGNLIYVAWNVSCPNTAEGKTFEDPTVLNELLSAAKEKGKTRPWVIKWSPNLGKNRLERLMEVSEQYCDGYIGANTLPGEYKGNKGGYSGPFVRDNMLETVRNLRSLTNKPIIACGGISRGGHMFEAKKAGANYFQVFNGFTVGSKSGPKFAHDVLNAYYAQLIISRNN